LVSVLSACMAGVKLSNARHVLIESGGFINNLV